MSLLRCSPGARRLPSWLAFASCSEFSYHPDLSTHHRGSSSSPSSSLSSSWWLLVLIIVQHHQHHSYYILVTIIPYYPISTWCLSWDVYICWIDVTICSSAVKQSPSKARGPSRTRCAARSSKRKTDCRRYGKCHWWNYWNCNDDHGTTISSHHGHFV